jgi:hypothetical protein
MKSSEHANLVFALGEALGRNDVGAIRQIVKRVEEHALIKQQIDAGTYPDKQLAQTDKVVDGVMEDIEGDRWDGLS